MLRFAASTLCKVLLVSNLRNTPGKLRTPANDNLPIIQYIWRVLNMYYMKRIIISLMIIACAAMSASAQKVSGDFSVLKDEVRARMTVDFSEASILGMTEEQYSAYEKDWLKDKAEVVSYYSGYASIELSPKLVIADYQFETKYRLVLKVRMIDARGNTDSDLYLLEGDNEIARAEGVFAQGGVFGTKLNLIKDGAKHSGIVIGRLLNKYL